jgi:molybdopterin-guanine dinucleotide biosynthesis protein A
VKRKIRSGGKPASVIILAGGKGRRMNADKARLTVRGQTLLERVIGQVAPYFNEILVSISPGQKVHIKEMRRAKAGPSRKLKADREGPALMIEAKTEPGVRFVEDEVPDLGPLGGILAGLRAAGNDVCAVVACDIPDAHIPLLRKLAKAAAAADISVPVTKRGQFEPLFAVYRKAVIPEIEDLLGAGERSILPLFARCRTERVPLGDADGLRNLNTRKDYRAYLDSLR